MGYGSGNKVEIRIGYNGRTVCTLFKDPPPVTRSFHHEDDGTNCVSVQGRWSANHVVLPLFVQIVIYGRGCGSGFVSWLWDLPDLWRGHW